MHRNECGCGTRPRFGYYPASSIGWPVSETKYVSNEAKSIFPWATTEKKDRGSSATNATNVTTMLQTVSYYFGTREEWC